MALTKIQCLKCGKLFTPKTQRARFCSDSCRVGFHQRGNMIDEQIRAIENAVTFITDTAAASPALILPEHGERMLGAAKGIKAAYDAIKAVVYE